MRVLLVDSHGADEAVGGAERYVARPGDERWLDEHLRIYEGVLARR